jgi:hypothetical protein
LGKLMDDAVGAARDAQTTRKTVESELAALSASPAQRLIDAPEHKEFSDILKNSQSPAKDFFALRQIAEEAGPSAVDGLKSSAAAYLLRGAQARREGQAFLSGDNIITALSDPRTMDAISAVLDPQELSRIQQIANELTVFQRSAAAREGGTKQIIPQDPVDTVLQLVARIAGASGARMATPPGGATIQNPQIGSQIARGLARRLTTESAEKLVVEAVTTNPALFEALLLNQRTAGPEQISQADAVLQRWMTNNLSRAAIDADDALEDFKAGLGLPQVTLPDPYTNNPFMPN